MNLDGLGIQRLLLYIKPSIVIVANSNVQVEKISRDVTRRKVTKRRLATPIQKVYPYMLVLLKNVVLFVLGKCSNTDG